MILSAQMQKSLGRLGSRKVTAPYDRKDPSSISAVGHLLHVIPNIFIKLYLTRLGFVAGSVAQVWTSE